MNDLKIALVCDWLTEIGGAEQVLKSLHELFPSAPIYTSQYNPKVDEYFSDPKITPIDVRTGWLNSLPSSARRYIAPLRQFYFKHLNLTKYDLVISVSGCDAKFVRTKPGAHLCYCHIPTQYYWSKHAEYLENPGFGRLNPLARPVFRLLTPILRRRDLAAASRPDYYITISKYSAREIREYYKREAKIISPPVNTALFQQPVENYKTEAGKCQINSEYSQNIKKKKSQTPLSQKYNIFSQKKQANKSEQKSCTISTTVENSTILHPITPVLPLFARDFLKKHHGKYYLNFSRQVTWKNLHILVEACLKAKKPLILIGDGPEHSSLQELSMQIAGSLGVPPDDYILFLPSQPQSNLPFFLTGARAFLFPSEEPFGIAPVEALAAGCPVIALKSGGALDYVQSGKNGLFFSTPTPNALIRALNKFEKNRSLKRTPTRSRFISNTASPFSEAEFKQKILGYIHEILEN